MGLPEAEAEAEGGADPRDALIELAARMRREQERYFALRRRGQKADNGACRDLEKRWDEGYARYRRARGPSPGAIDPRRHLPDETPFFGAMGPGG